MNLLKKANWFLGTLRMIPFLLCFSFPAYAADETGFLDTITSNEVKGWAWSSSNPQEALEITLKVTNTATQTTTAQESVTANLYRSDLADKGTGLYGFQVTIPWDTFEDGTYLVEAYTNQQLLPNSQTYTVRAGYGNLRFLGIYKTTGYCPCSRCSEGWGRHTSTGAIATASHTIAVDPRVIPYGSKVMINGVIYTAEDCGGAVKGNHIDIFFDTHGETRAWGTRNAEVYLVQP